MKKTNHIRKLLFYIPIKMLRNINLFVTIYVRRTFGLVSVHVCFRHRSMLKLNNFIFLILTFLITNTYSEIKYNNLQDKLVLQLLKVKPKTNLVASPLLLRFPLCKLAAAAEGEAKEELMTVLGYKDESLLSNCYTRVKKAVRMLTTTDLTMLNRIFINYTDDMNPDFVFNSTDSFGVQVDKVGFNYPKAALDYINRLVAAGTFKRINEVLDANDIDKDTTMIIINAVHFKGTWEFPFDFRVTRVMKFYHIDTRISRVPMMTKADSFNYIATDDCKLVSIRFGSWRSAITFVVPDSTHGLPVLLNKMQDDPNYINNLVKHMKDTLIRVYLPRFKIKTYVDWTGFLQELGLYTIFNKNASGLSGILKQPKEKSAVKNISLNKVKQKLFLQIDELGVARFTRASDIGRTDLPLSLPIPVVAADRPFYFQITLDFENARYELFTGVYYGPEAGTIMNP